MNSVALVIALAISWHVSMLWIERSRRPCIARPSLEKLLHFVELDLLNTLRAELVRLLRMKPELEPRYQRELLGISDRLKTLGEHDVP